MSNNVSFRVYYSKGRQRRDLVGQACFAPLNRGDSYEYDFKNLKRIVYVCRCSKDLKLDAIQHFVNFTRRVFDGVLDHKLRISKRHFKDLSTSAGWTSKVHVIQRFTIDRKCWKRNLLLCTWVRLLDEYPRLVQEFYDDTIGQSLNLDQQWRYWLKVVLRNSGWGHALWDGSEDAVHTMSLAQFLERFTKQNLSYVTSYFEAYKLPEKQTK